MLGASLVPVTVGKLEICPGKAPAEQHGYDHLLVVVGFHAVIASIKNATSMTVKTPMWIKSRTSATLSQSIFFMPSP
jgi:hypothetical protein